MNSLMGNTTTGKKLNLNNTLNYLDTVYDKLDKFEVTTSTPDIYYSDSANITIKATKLN
ncbi:MAG: hypothetical protein U9Q66_02620 [Patescibacteria group bacterium]|nr:hypothetical protein [Patescibacteria group bacterium]